MRAIAFFALAAIIPALVLAGCSTHSYIYRPVPDYLIPVYPSKLPSIPSAALSSLRDDTYTALAERDRLLRDYAGQCRALRGDGAIK